MKIFYPDKNDTSQSELSVFLAGPTLRDNPGRLTPWRDEAIGVFKDFCFDGSLYVPEPYGGNYKEQILWEERHLDLCDCVLFWVPRNMKTLPGLTTNVEFGDWMRSGKVVLGFPSDAEHVSYLAHKAEKYSIPTSNCLVETVRSAIDMAIRSGPKNVLRPQKSHPDDLL